MCLPQEDIAAYRARKSERPEESTLSDLARSGNLFFRGRPNPRAQRLLQNPQAARAFLSECSADTDEGRELRECVESHGLDIDTLRDYLTTPIGYPEVSPRG